jgi:hypothetical protein
MGAAARGPVSNPPRLRAFPGFQRPRIRLTFAPADRRHAPPERERQRELRRARRDGGASGLTGRLEDVLRVFTPTKRLLLPISLRCSCRTGCLQEVWPGVTRALAAPIARVISLLTPAELGLLRPPFHEPFHGDERGKAQRGQPRHRAGLSAGFGPLGPVSHVSSMIKPSGPGCHYGSGRLDYRREAC